MARSGSFISTAKAARGGATCLLVAALVGCGWPTATRNADRLDLLEGLIAVEAAYAPQGLDEAGQARINRKFDQATLVFFVGQLDFATRGLREVALELTTGRAGDLSDLPFVLSRIEPYTWTPDDPPPTVTIGMMPTFRPVADFDVTLRLVDAAGAVVHEQTLRVRGTAVRREMLNLATPPAPGTYIVELEGPNRAVLRVGRWRVASASLDAQRVANATRLEAITPTSDALVAAKTTAQARNALLLDTPTEDSSAAYLAAPDALAAAVADELDALADDNDPYHGREGDTWRVITSAEPPVPLRVYVPDGLGDRPAVPLLIALHGAGGDENMFFHAYGGGAIKALAARYGFIVATPRTERIIVDAALLPALLDELADDYRIDRARVYLLGHSLGAAAAVELATKHPDVVRAAVLMSGGDNLATAAQMPPTRVYAGGRDPIARPPRPSQTASAAQQRGLDITFIEDEFMGHTLLVARYLEDAVAWLVAQD